MQLKQTLSIFLILTIILSLCSPLQSQTCKSTGFQPTKCASCTTCTGSTLSCCDSTKDSLVGSAMGLLQFARASQDCVNIMKMYSCASCDPKNQQFLTISGLKICKKTCQDMKNSCGLSGSSMDCNGLTDSDCWNGANSLGMNHVLVVLLVVLVGIFMF